MTGHAAPFPPPPFPLVTAVITTRAINVRPATYTTLSSMAGCRSVLPITLEVPNPVCPAAPLHSFCSRRSCLARLHIAHLHHANAHCWGRAPLLRSTRTVRRARMPPDQSNTTTGIAKSGHSSASRSPFPPAPFCWSIATRRAGADTANKRTTTPIYMLAFVARRPHPSRLPSSLP
jgi:hypothetical protein